MDQPPWLSLAACPECRGTVAATETGYACPKCQRDFAQIDGAIDLRPKEFVLALDDTPKKTSAKSFFVRQIYAKHNNSRSVQEALATVLGALDGGGWGMNLGSGGTSLHERMLNFDAFSSANVQALGDAHCLPFRDGAFRCIVSQEVFEHLRSPWRAMKEVVRVLQDGGLFLITVPLIIGIHSGPHDYWRFARLGLQTLMEDSGLEVLSCRQSAGPGTSMYRVAVEFWATVAASVWRRLYMPSKAASALALAPLRWLDRLVPDDSNTNRIPAGYVVVARKRV